MVIICLAVFILISLTFHNQIHPQSRITASAYGIVLVSTFATMHVYNGDTLGFFCESPFPALISKTPGFAALEPLVDTLNNVCEASFVHNKTTPVQCDCTNYVSDNTIRIAQNELLDVFFDKLKTMDTDVWILDVLEHFRKMYNIGEYDLKMSIQERAQEIEQPFKAVIDIIRPIQTESQSPISPSTAKTKPNPLDSYNELESRTPSAVDAVKSDRAVDASGSTNPRD